ncbi:hypothetical protein AMAG_19803 [Allomyces macrogynus ATCC 38327]|uniref:Uncharacterized protein n=1 Tax=Allomyces macrogynus (strain ATCC 38327) TaxID=578462 RepID=A0A0L0T0W1_ALLM3|nr:hypothetical protein AMAG_19803 [Allomyces macrogynus ATCC 38327]|eukprot:KNE68428.1 hypothetical protein AMAG_19803 [Allomyces macrogynus ATCC 38327]
MLGHAPRPAPTAPAPSPRPIVATRVPEPSAACGLRRRTSSTVHSIVASAPTRAVRASSLPRSPRSPSARSFPPYDAPLDDGDSDVDDDCEPEGWSASRHYAQYASSYTSSVVEGGSGSTPPWADRTASSSTRYLANAPPAPSTTASSARAAGSRPPRGVPVAVAIPLSPPYSPPSTSSLSSSTPRSSAPTAQYSLFGGGGGMRAPGPVPLRGPARVPVSVFGSPPPVQGGFVPRYAPPGAGAVQTPTMGMPWSVR